MLYIYQISFYGLNIGHNATHDKEMQLDALIAPEHQLAEQLQDTGCPLQCRPCRLGLCCAGNAGSGYHPGCFGRWTTLC